MELYFIRHGSRVAGPDVAGARPGISGCLSRQGLNQAEALRQQLAGVAFHAACSSDLGRAVETAGVVLGEGGPAVQTFSWLREWQAAPEADCPDEVAARRRAVENRYTDDLWDSGAGEGPLSLLHRVGPPFLEWLHKQGCHRRLGGYVVDPAARTRALAVFAHAGCLDALIGFLLNLTPTPAARFDLEHAGLIRLRFIQGRQVWYPAVVGPGPA